jgi:hypothetical protein
MTRKDLRRQIAIEDFGTADLPARLMREARRMASRLKIIPKQALVRVQANDRRLAAKLKRENKHALQRVLRRKVSRTQRGNIEPKQQKSSWPENNNPGYVSIVSGGLPSLGKRR